MNTKSAASDASKRTRKSARSKKDQRKTRLDFPVVGIGASAGGLEAFQNFFSHLPTDTGMAFVVIQHLDPSDGGLLPGLLARYTGMRVAEIKNGIAIEPDSVYVIPANRDLSIEDGSLTVQEPQTKRGIRMPIDFFLRHLAEAQGDRAYAVILSGTGTDGTLGIKAIKENFGLVLVQDPEEAKFSGMPQSAIDTGLADYIGPAEELPKKLVAYASNVAATPLPLQDKTLEIVQQILAVLRTQTGHNFAGLKENMLIRRIQRRRDILELPSLQQYLTYLKQNDSEAQLLYKELLIGVTNFFRDSEAWDALKGAITQELLKRPPEKALRIWDVGCSTGEEAYSLAITLSEAIDAAGLTDRLEWQIFATDIDADSIDVARQGRYYPNIALDVNAERLSRFFTKEDANYRVKKSIRERIVFAVQDVTRDPPFTRLDLLVCRNLLIYFTSDLQQRLVPLFHYSLNPAGLLFLGSSESLGKFEADFEVFSSKWKIYLNTSVYDETRYEIPYPVYNPDRFERTQPKEYRPSLREVVQHALLSTFAPAAVVVNRDGDIVYFFGKTGRYLEPATGKASLNVNTLAREGLRLELNNAIYRAVRTDKEVLIKGLSLEEDGNVNPVNVRVRPLDKVAAVKDLYLVTFEVRPPAPQPTPGRGRKGKHEERELAYENEIKSLRERVQSAAEEIETAREEFKSTMEELQSTNEELQSTNEELKTSREELESTNEELVTVNSELNQKNQDLAHANDDLQNLLDSIDLATLFVDRRLRIMRFSPSVTRIFNVIASDVGRPLSDISLNLEDTALFTDVERVIQSGDERESDVKTKEGKWYHVRIMPYRAIDDNVLGGAVISFSDITGQKTSQAEAQKAASILAQGGDSIIAYDLDGTVSFWNAGAEKLYGWPNEDVLGKEINSVLDSVYPLPFEQIKGMLLDSRSWTGRIKRRRRDGTYTTNACQLLLRHNDKGEPTGILEICNGR